MYILSTISGHRLEDVKAASSGPVWYQLYLMGGRGAAEAAIERARVAGFSAFVVTIDVPVAGIRERDVRNGTKELSAATPLPESSRFFRRCSRAPAWLIRFLVDGGVPALPNIVIPGTGPMPLIDVAAALANHGHLGRPRWIRGLWPGPIVVKGVLTGDDARRAIDEGAVAMSVSNHGGRQLDCVHLPLCARCPKWQRPSAAEPRC